MWSTLPLIVRSFHAASLSARDIRQYCPHRWRQCARPGWRSGRAVVSGLRLWRPHERPARQRGHGGCGDHRDGRRRPSGADPERTSWREHTDEFRSGAPDRAAVTRPDRRRRAGQLPDPAEWITDTFSGLRERELPVRDPSRGGRCYRDRAGAGVREIWVECSPWPDQCDPRRATAGHLCRCAALRLDDQSLQGRYYGQSR